MGCWWWRRCEFWLLSGEYDVTVIGRHVYYTGGIGRTGEWIAATVAAGVAARSEVVKSVRCTLVCRPPAGGATHVNAGRPATSTLLAGLLLHVVVGR